MRAFKLACSHTQSFIWSNETLAIFRPTEKRPTNQLTRTFAVSWPKCNKKRVRHLTCFNKFNFSLRCRRHYRRCLPHSALGLHSMLVRCLTWHAILTENVWPVWLLRKLNHDLWMIRIFTCTSPATTTTKTMATTKPIALPLLPQIAAEARAK